MVKKIFSQHNVIEKDKNTKVLNPINEEEIKQSEDSESLIDLGNETSVDTFSE